MENFNVIVFLWRVSFFVFIFAFLIGFTKKSWMIMLISFIASLPIAYYFFGAENAWRLVSLIPFLLLCLTIYYWKRN
ncbi:hypothetical protein [Bacillus massilinigeriensis]|uniref:hypothetical protein n=1 Tax=Bacillus massilionigeriensis TaxID=1805475 RepID=UPI00096B3BE6|nr:hypothetical protein [Bacillus massilionigeriensis]